MDLASRELLAVARAAEHCLVGHHDLQFDYRIHIIHNRKKIEIINNNKTRKTRVRGYVLPPRVLAPPRPPRAAARAPPRVAGAVPGRSVLAAAAAAVVAAGVAAPFVVSSFFTSSFFASPVAVTGAPLVAGPASLTLARGG